MDISRLLQFELFPFPLILTVLSETMFPSINASLVTCSVLTSKSVAKRLEGWKVRVAVERDVARSTTWKWSSEEMGSWRGKLDEN